MSRSLGRAPLALALAVFAACGLDSGPHADEPSVDGALATAAPDLGETDPSAADAAPAGPSDVESVDDVPRPAVAGQDPSADGLADVPAEADASLPAWPEPDPAPEPAPPAVAPVENTAPDAASGITPPERAGPVRVASDGSGDFATITEAVASLTSQREVVVAPGVYREALVFDRRVTLTGEGRRVIIEGGAQPAVSLDTKSQVVLRGLTLLSGTAAASVGVGQLVLEDCRLEARPSGVALRSTSPVSQLVVRGCLIDAARGTAMELHPATTGELADCTFAWETDNDDPLLRGDAAPPMIVRGCRLAWRRQSAPQLLPEVTGAELSNDGRPALVVDPERGGWPAWSRAGVTHFETLTSAVAAAGVNQRIDVAAGRYEEQVGLRQATHLRPLGAPRSVVVAFDGAPCVWQNATARSTVTGFVLEGDVVEKTATIQVNGGRLDLLDCVLANPAGNTVVATSAHAACEIVFEDCELSAGRTAVYATGGTTSVSLTGGRIQAVAQGVLAVGGGQVRLEGVELQAGKVGVEVWGTESQVELIGGRVVSTPQVLLHAKGARRSQIITTDVDTSAAAVTDG